MDVRLNPEKALGVPAGSLHVIRNAGGRVKNLLGSIVVSQLLFGTRDVTSESMSQLFDCCIFVRMHAESCLIYANNLLHIKVIHHTRCGMVTTREKLEDALHEKVDHRLDRQETDKLFKELDLHPIDVSPIDVLFSAVQTLMSFLLSLISVSRAFARGRHQAHPRVSTAGEVRRPWLHLERH